MTIVSEQEIASPKAFKETIPRGSIVFPMQYSLCNTVNPYYDLPLHWHDEFELIHVISGNYTMFIADHEITLNKGDLCIIPGKLIHGDGKEKTKCLFESVVFDIDLLRQHSYSPDTFISDILNNNIFLENVITADHTAICDIIAKFFESIKVHTEGYDLISSGYLLIFFGLMKKEKLYTEKKILSVHKRVRTEQIESVLNLIRKNYDQELTLEVMASTAGLSPKYFCRLFREMTDHSPIEYLNWFRINRACSLLRETNDKLPDIAFACGFNDFSYFIKIFRRYKGMTPFKYRTFDPTKIKEIELGQGFGRPEDKEIERRLKEQEGLEDDEDFEDLSDEEMEEELEEK